MNAMLPRTCRWLSPNPDIDLKYGSLALLVVENIGSQQNWAVSADPGGFRVIEELVPCVYGETVRVDTSFGDALEDWMCDCREYRPRNARGLPHGCLHCKVLFAATKKLGLIH